MSQNVREILDLWVLFKGGSYLLIIGYIAGLIQGRISFKGRPLSRIYCTVSEDEYVNGLILRGQNLSLKYRGGLDLLKEIL